MFSGYSNFLLTVYGFMFYVLCFLSTVYDFLLSVDCLWLYILHSLPMLQPLQYVPMGTLPRAPLHTSPAPLAPLHIFGAPPAPQHMAGTPLAPLRMQGAPLPCGAPRRAAPRVPPSPLYYPLRLPLQPLNPPTPNS